jgi:hypothetical protein
MRERGYEVFDNPEYKLSSPYYESLIESAGVEILVNEDQHDYQGDSLLVVRRGSEYGYLCFGWGSCSGCDALQACDTYGELAELRQELYDGIRWFDTATELLDYVNGKDWETEFLDRDLSSRFVASANNALREVFP